MRCRLCRQVRRADAFLDISRRIPIWKVFSFDVAAKLSLIMLDLATDRLAREMASLTGETLTVAIRKAVAELLERA